MYERQGDLEIKKNGCFSVCLVLLGSKREFCFQIPLAGNMEGKAPLSVAFYVWTTTQYSPWKISRNEVWWLLIDVQCEMACGAC